MVGRRGRFVAWRRKFGNRRSLRAAVFAIDVPPACPTLRSTIIWRRQQCADILETANRALMTHCGCLKQRSVRTMQRKVLWSRRLCTAESCRSLTADGLFFLVGPGGQPGSNRLAQRLKIAFKPRVGFDVFLPIVDEGQLYMLRQGSTNLVAIQLF